MQAPEWLVDYFADVDAMRLDAFVARHADDVVVTFGNNPPSVGKEEVEAAIGGFWSMIGGLRHTFVNVWDGGDGTTILESLVDYRTPTDEHVTLPCVSLLHRTGGLVDSLRVHIDLAPLFERLAAAAAH